MISTAATTVELQTRPGLAGTWPIQGRRDWRPATGWSRGAGLPRAAGQSEQPQLSTPGMRACYLNFNALRVPIEGVDRVRSRASRPLCIVRQRIIDLDLWFSKIGSIGNAVSRNPMLRHQIEGSISGSNQSAIAQELNHGQGI